MRIRLGCEMSYDLPAPTPMIVMLNVHYSRVADLERPDHLVTQPSVPIGSYRDSHGNWCCRLVGPPGRLVLTTDAVIADSGAPDPQEHGAEQHAVEDLPSEALQFLLGSRYCETDRLSDEAWRLFGQGPTGWARVQAVCDFVHRHVTFGYEHSRATRTAAETYFEGVGVCRDYTHLAVAFCRALNVPTRYCTGYVSDIGQPPPYAPMDFAAWMEVFLGGRWHLRPAQQHAADRAGADRARPRRRRRAAHPHLRAEHAERLPGLDRRGRGLSGGFRILRDG
jgi:transglutaminase-like putative cysteine protease